jgi:hypothetical protein
MDRKSTRVRQESVEVEIIPPHADHSKTIEVSTQRRETRTPAKSSKRTRKKPEQAPEVNDSLDSNDVCSIIDNTTDTVNQDSAKKTQEDDKKYCEFCGALLDEQFGTQLAQRRKYCSPRCRSIATGRRTRARLGVRPTRHEISKLNPLYFN